MSLLHQAYTQTRSLVLWTLGLMTFATLGVAFISLSFLIHPRFLWRFARYTCQVSLLMMGQRLEVHGTFPPRRDGPYIYLFNHTSLIDTFILFAVLPEFTGAVGKAEQFKIPLWGWLLKRWGAIPIYRAHRMQAIESINRAAEVVSAGQSLVISPEGTRSSDGALQPFKKGPFHIAIATRTPLIPIMIRGAYASKNKHSWIVRPGLIKIYITEQLTPAAISYDSVDALHEQTHCVFQERLQEDRAH